jgi:hypothetical protein
MSLKVYKSHLGFKEVMVAAASLKEASRLMNYSYHAGRQFIHNIPLQNDDAAIALAAPGIVFERPNNHRGESWTRGTQIHYEPRPSRKRRPRTPITIQPSARSRRDALLREALKLIVFPIDEAESLNLAARIRKELGE